MTEAPTFQMGLDGSCELGPSRPVGRGSHTLLCSCVSRKLKTKEHTAVDSSTPVRNVCVFYLRSLFPSALHGYVRAAIVGKVKRDAPHCAVKQSTY
jgi:hypothetical protein